MCGDKDVSHCLKDGTFTFSICHNLPEHLRTAPFEEKVFDTEMIASDVSHFLLWVSKLDHDISFSLSLVLFARASSM